MYEIWRMSKCKNIASEGSFSVVSKSTLQESFFQYFSRSISIVAPIGRKEVQALFFSREKEHLVESEHLARAPCVDFGAERSTWV